MSSKANTNFLQLPMLDTFEPLTKGTNLPCPPFEPSPAPSASSSIKDHNLDTGTTATDATTPPRSPVSPASPTRPGSMRRFLSRVSMNSAYDKDHTAPPMSPTTSIMTVPGKPPTKRSWWRRREKNPAPSIDAALDQAPTPPPRAAPNRPRTPPPKLPDLEAPVTSFDDNLFSNIK